MNTSHECSKAAPVYYDTNFSNYMKSGRNSSGMLRSATGCLALDVSHIAFWFRLQGVNTLDIRSYRRTKTSSTPSQKL